MTRMVSALPLIADDELLMTNRSELEDRLRHLENFPQSSKSTFRQIAHQYVSVLHAEA